MRGLSLVEVLISLVIGLVVVGAVLVSYVGSGQTNKRQAAYAEMNENAQTAMSMMKNDLLLAGYAQAKGTVTVGAVTTFTRTYNGNAVFGCDKGFVSANSTGAVACNGTGSLPPSIEMSYEADTTNTVPTGGNVPSDCLGNGLTAQTVGAINYYVTNNRYYLATSSTGRSELHCASVEGSAGQPLVDNVENMQIWYGQADAASARQIVRYVTADVINLIPGNWPLVVSVRICLLMRSAEPVFSAEDTTAGITGYLDCSSNSLTSTDRYARRAYFTTTTLRNKMTF